MAVCVQRVQSSTQPIYEDSAACEPCVPSAPRLGSSSFFNLSLQELEPFGIEVIEVVAAFVRSNILHHGLYAPDHSLYLPIKSTIERIKYEGNANGMDTNAFAVSVVDKVTRRRPNLEIWEGTLAWRLRFLVTVCPLRLMVQILFPFTRPKLVIEIS